MSRLANLKIGRLLMGRSTSVVLASDHPPIQVTNASASGDAVGVLKADGTAASQNAELAAGSFLAVPFSTTTNQAMVVTDVGNYRWVSVQVAQNGTNGNVMFQTSNDGVNWTTNTLTIAGSNANTQIQGNTTAAGIFHGPVAGRYFRINVASLTAGTTSGVVVFSAVPGGFPQTTVAATQAGAYTFSTVASSTTPPNTQVAASASNVVLRASNANRKQLMIYNGGSTALLVALGVTAS